MRHCTEVHCTVLHCTTLHCAALHRTALYCTALDYNLPIYSTVIARVEGLISCRCAQCSRVATRFTVQYRKTLGSPKHIHHLLHHLPLPHLHLPLHLLLHGAATITSTTFNLHYPLINLCNQDNLLRLYSVHPPAYLVLRGMAATSITVLPSPRRLGSERIKGGT